MELNMPIGRQIDETEEFKKLSKEIDYLSEFFNSLSELIYLNGHIISFFSDKEFYTLDLALINGSAQTLRNIKFCCSIGGFSDANTLIRKLRDDLTQYVYLLNIISLREFFIEEKVETNDAEEVANSLLNLQFNTTYTEDEQAVIAWLKNSVSDLKRPVKKKLEFENYMTVLKQNEQINHVLVEYKLSEYWETLRKKLNNYVHNNGASFSRHNCITASDKNLGTHLKNISFRTTYVSSFFVVVLLMIDSSLISATDYMDHLDSNVDPPEGSQYFIANFVQDFIDKKVAPIHPELKKYLIDNNIHGMTID
jgi:hypothetical protein